MKPVLHITAYFIAVAVLVCYAKPAGAQEKAQIIERWECFDIFDFSRKTALVKLTRLRVGNSEFGKVEVAGSTQEARFEIDGIDRRWNFGNGSRYSFIIRPNKIGAYYEFTVKSRIKPSQIFQCETKP